MKKSRVSQRTVTEKRLYCPACYSENLGNSVYCCQCGAPVRLGVPARIRRSTGPAVVVISLLLLSVVMATVSYFFYVRQGSQPPAEQPYHTAQPEPSGLRQDITPVFTQPDKGKNESSLGEDFSEGQQGEGVERVLVGKVSIINPDGFTIAVFPAAVTGGSWLALPACACIGGNRWFFSRGEADDLIPIEGGLWGTGDPVGFWRLTGEERIPGPDFAVWQPEKPVRFLSMGTNVLSKPLLLTPSGMEGVFLYSVLPGNRESGVFLQEGKVVGWSFAELPAGAYMWNRSSDINLLYENYVDDFYNETFAGGREEYVTTALTTGRDLSPQSQLQLFVEGFRLPPKLLPEMTPGYLKTERVFPYILQLVSYLMTQGEYHSIASLAEEPLLWELNDPALLMNVLQAVRYVYGVETAINFLAGADEAVQQVDEEAKAELQQLHRQLYLEWIQTLRDSGEIAAGRLVYTRAQSRFGNFPALQLLGVELALAENDWAEAERLLYQRDYPAQFRETVTLLADRISDLKGRENKIVISFQPGSREIPVKARINELTDHEFLVDTGASFVTVPYSTVAALGLEESISTYSQEVQTAGGLVSANWVILSSIELQGWLVSDVKALVIDLPHRPGLGLLGLNFLSRFRFDLQADEGILTLEPK